MSLTPEENANGYSSRLRPKAGAFDLVINRNRYGLVRRTIGRRRAQLIQPKCRTISVSSSSSSSASSSPRRSRSASPLPDVNKRKIRFEPVKLNDDAESVSASANDKSNEAVMVTVPKVWHLPARATQIVRKPPPTVYDVTTSNHF